MPWVGDSGGSAIPAPAGTDSGPTKRAPARDPPAAPQRPARARYTAFTEEWIIQATALAHSTARYAKSIISEEQIVMRDTVAPDKVAQNIYNLIVALSKAREASGSGMEDIINFLKDSDIASSDKCPHLSPFSPRN